VILSSPERVEAVRAAAEAVAADVVSLTADIAAIAAPTGEEAERSHLVEKLFCGEGLAATRDRLDDVVATLPGRLPPVTGAPRLLIAAHIDTVFGRSTPLHIVHSDGRLSGPGVGDNSLAVAAVVKLAHLLARAAETPAVDVLLCGNVGEEGLGNLRGIREVMKSHADVGAVVALEGHNLGRVTHVAVGSRRFRITVDGPGGHSWGDFGRPSAIHAMARLIAEIDAIPLPRSPKTTLNFGTIEGGVSVNTIAPRATCLLDLRSIDETALRRISDRVRRLVDRRNKEAAVVFAIETIGERPAGIVEVDRPIVRVAAQTLAALGIEPNFDASSTDANIPIAAGLPSVCLGLTTGGNVHRVDEFIDIRPVPIGLAQIALMTIALSEHLAARAL
jgi:acetylornithine deacetylase/succinyl-diaminopimelate desuccinylase-like protein